MSRLKKTFLAGLVALAIVAAIVVIEASTNNMTIGLMGNAEQFTITKVRFVQGAPVGDTVKVEVRNVGAFTVAIQIGSVNGINAININSGQALAIPGTLLEITLTFPNGTLVYGAQQQIKLVTSKRSVPRSVLHIMQHVLLSMLHSEMTLIQPLQRSSCRHQL
jgi:hypothetical protein